MRAKGVEPLLLTVSKAELILAEERKRQRQTPPGVVVRRVFTNLARLRRKTRLGE
jgi:hypothetical protein